MSAEDRSIADRMAAVARSGTGPGSTILYACLAQERAGITVDWRELALSLAEVANASHALAVEAMALAQPPIWIVGQK